MEGRKDTLNHLAVWQLRLLFLASNTHPRRLERWLLKQHYISCLHPKVELQYRIGAIYQTEKSLEHSMHAGWLSVFKHFRWKQCIDTLHGETIIVYKMLIPEEKIEKFLWKFQYFFFFRENWSLFYHNWHEIKLTAVSILCLDEIDYYFGFRGKFYLMMHLLFTSLSGFLSFFLRLLVLPLSVPAIFFPPCLNFIFGLYVTPLLPFLSLNSIRPLSERETKYHTMFDSDVQTDMWNKNVKENFRDYLVTIQYEVPLYFGVDKKKQMNCY